ncbi:hypothetical protein OOK36_54145 [Streptomyces sp. NBC_00365]|uniref:hypothetical protein n=1 Tax=Streptomyces sp. NBC_00365 TaxID=2975726 RepID=UPI0022536787|nr:hypothetical protein [Streptomyces sp. NBC_00365]MCX5097427.1 hypothetical protein [Streptomyces sp. NBC_00365]
MAHAVTEIRRTTGRQVDLDNPDHVDLNDRLAFELIQASDTVGLFQLESPGQQDLVGRLQPRHMQDVIADISLFRPGPARSPAACPLKSLQTLCPTQLVSLYTEAEPRCCVALRRAIVFLFGLPVVTEVTEHVGWDLSACPLRPT